MLPPCLRRLEMDFICQTVEVTDVVDALKRIGRTLPFGCTGEFLEEEILYRGFGDECRGMQNATAEHLFQASVEVGDHETVIIGQPNRDDFCHNIKPPFKKYILILYYKIGKIANFRLLY